jgi:hypothetical protein
METQAVEEGEWGSKKQIVAEVEVEAEEDLRDSQVDGAADACEPADSSWTYNRSLSRRSCVDSLLQQLSPSMADSA